jgi:hypothetical protein
LIKELAARPASDKRLYRFNSTSRRNILPPHVSIGTSRRNILRKKLLRLIQVKFTRMIR